MDERGTESCACPGGPGLWLTDDGAVIGVASRHAERIWVCLFDNEDEEVARIALRNRDGERRRVAIVVDSIDSQHGVSHTVERIRELGVPGFDAEVVGTDRGVDRRLPAAAEIERRKSSDMNTTMPSR